MDATDNMEIQAVQKEIIDNYYTRLKRDGYMSFPKVGQTLFSVLLLDTVSMFGEFITSSFKQDVDRIMRRLDCCGCSLVWSKQNASQPFYIIGEWTSAEVPKHTHIIGEIIGLQARLDSIDEEIQRVDAKANAGL